MLVLFLVGASRALARYWLGGLYLSQLKLGTLPKVLIYGAGSAGRQLANALANSYEMRVVGYLDDDDRLHGHVLNGLAIYSPQDLPGLVVSLGISDVLLALPTANRKRRNEILALMQQAQVSVRTLPSVMELAQGKVSTADLRELDIDDLLGRDSVPPNHILLGRNVTRKVVLVTGAGGSIGSELCRQILKLKPQTLLLVDQSEYALYEIHQELLEKVQALGEGAVQLVPLLASVRDAERMREVITTWSPDTIYHAAAYKHVPLMEAHPEEAVRTNCLGTAVVARLAREFQCEAFVMVSTDKAVNPTNVMGATKRAAEHAINAENRHPGNKTRFVTTRFGNVLGSNGSVVPLFQRQIAQGGPLTVTHKEITRYFMTIPEAVRLVLEAGHMGRGGELYVFDMGEPVRIYDLALQLIQLNGLRPGVDIEVKEVGLRPGEKLYEELLANEENTVPTHHPKIFIATAISWEDAAFRTHWDFLLQALNAQQQTELLLALKHLVPEYQPKGH